MKNIKDLKIKTLEGFSVKNLQRFPSMEWGDEGGLQANVLYNGKEVFQIYQEGNGGPAITYWTDYGKSIEKEVRERAFEFLKRVDKDYQEGSEYQWLMAKEPKDINDDDFETMVVLIEEQYERVKFVKKSFKNGYKTVAILSNDCQVSYLQYYIDNVPLEKVKEWLVRNDKDKEFTEVEMVYSQEQLATM